LEAICTELYRTLRFYLIRNATAHQSFDLREAVVDFFRGCIIATLGYDFRKGQANAKAAFDFALQIATAKAPSDIVELWTTHARKQFEMLSEQTKELTALGQKIAGERTEPIARSVNQAFKKAS
jgi:hypothetical protein